MVCTEFEDGAGVLLHLESKYYFSLNETGLFLWKRIDGRSGEERLARSLEASNDVSYERALKSVRRFLGRLRSLNLIFQFLCVISLALLFQCGRKFETSAGGSKIQSKPCGRRIAYVSDKDGPVNIYSVNEDGSDQRRLTFGVPECSSCGDYLPSWSPQGDKIAFSSYRDRSGGMNIFVMDSDGTGLTQLTYETAVVSHPDISCNGKKIIYTFRDQIWVMDSDGSNKKQLTTVQDTPYGAGAARWSPDCTQIAYIADPGCYHSSGYISPQRPSSYSSLWLMDPDGGNKRPVLCGGNPLLFCLSPLAWSCDGKNVLYTNIAGGRQGIYLVNTVGCTESIVISPGSVNAGDPSWYPSCDTFVFRCERGDGLFKICTMSLRGTDMKTVAPDVVFGIQPSFSPPLCQ